MLGAIMRRTRVVLGVLLSGIVTVVALAPRPARSQTAEDKTAAEALYEEGKKLLAEKRFAEACARFESSQRLDPGVGTLLFLGECLETVGRTASAWSTFREAASAAKAAGQGDRERIARDRAAQLDAKLFKLTLTAPAAATTPGLQVTRNDISVKLEVLGAAIPVDPGIYRLAASAPGKKTWTGTVDIPAGPGGRTVEIPALEDAPAPPPGPTATAAPTATVAPTAEPPPGWSTGRTAGLVLGIAGLAGVGAGAAFGGVAASQFADAKALCPDVKCGDQGGVDKSKSAGAMADVSTGVFVAGGALLAAGVVLFLVSPSSAPAASGRASAPARTSWISPLAGNGVAGLRAGSTW